MSDRLLADCWQTARREFAWKFFSRRDAGAYQMYPSGYRCIFTSAKNKIHEDGAAKDLATPSGVVEP
jgi:hypothetical protein